MYCGTGIDRLLIQTESRATAVGLFTAFDLTYEAFNSRAAGGTAKPVVLPGPDWMVADVNTDGIDDLNLTLVVAGHTRPWAPWFMNPTLTVAYP